MRQLSFDNDSEIPDKIFQEFKNNGSLETIPKQLKVRVIPENTKSWRDWQQEAQDQFGQALTYIPAGKLKTLDLGSEKNSKDGIGQLPDKTPIVLYWRKWIDIKWAEI